ncbi:aurora kinase A-interacting protein isoform X2 [Phycodurus eques]|uniref:aurora kinase A-interacting protein isoform X2 n=1 Tax=Phycodurus eques TaxID=693459 RepID=UPI002ACEAF9B|nr:aurora kinase A-interacting protein isoform X2 [Phycodurus eques]
MFTANLLPRLRLLHRATFFHGDILSGCVRPAVPACSSSLNKKTRYYSTAADNRYPPRWVQLEPELDEALVPRKLSQERGDQLEEKVLPPVSVPVLEDGDNAAIPLRCKNVLEIRRRKMNRHKYKKLLKRTKFLRRRVQESRGRKKQKRFEEDLKRIWRRAGLKKAPEGWSAPKLFIKQHGNRRD